VGPQLCEDAVEVTRSIGQAEGEGRAVPSEPVGGDRFSARELRGHVGEGVRLGTLHHKNIFLFLFISAKSLKNHSKS